MRKEASGVPSFTKKAIVESFLSLLAKKPLEKITVRDVVDDCGVNRNTFYYYFQDTYAVVEELCRIGEERIPTGETLGGALSAYFLIAADFAAAHPRAVRNLLASVGRDGAERYLGGTVERVAAECLTRAAGKPLTREQLALPMAALRHAFLGTCVDWLTADKKPEAAALADRMRRLTDLYAAALLAELSDKT